MNTTKRLLSGGCGSGKAIETETLLTLIIWSTLCHLIDLQWLRVGLIERMEPEIRDTLIATRGADVENERARGGGEAAKGTGENGGERGRTRENEDERE